MAHPEEVAPLIPETLPEDFSDWDGEASPAPLPSISTDGDAARIGSEGSKPRGQSSYRDAVVRASAPRAQRMWGSDPPAPTFGRQQNEFSNWQKDSSSEPVSRNSGEVEVARVLSDNAKPLGQSVEREAALSPAADKSRDSRTTSSVTAVAKPQSLAGGLAVADELPGHGVDSQDAAHTTNLASVKPGSSDNAAAKMREADEAIYQLFSMKNVEVVPKQKPSRNKWVMVVAVGAFSILLSFVLTILLGHHGAKAAANLPVQSFSGATVTLVKENVAKPSAGEPVAQGKPLAAANTQAAADSQPVQDAGTANPTQAVTETQTEMMNDQLAAPRMIPRDATRQVAEDAPPPAVNLGLTGADAHNAIAGVLGGHALSVVQAPPPKPIVISSGVAVGMLIQKSAPVYPAIAKAARVSGNVVMHATISKNGSIKDLRVLSGPVMLRQAAVDAVRNWRYRPYTLNKEPIDVDTTIEVAFTLGN